MCFVLDIGDFTIYHGCKEFSSNLTKLQIIAQSQSTKEGKHSGFRQYKCTG